MPRRANRANQRANRKLNQAKDWKQTVLTEDEADILDEWASRLLAQGWYVGRWRPTRAYEYQGSQARGQRARRLSAHRRDVELVFLQGPSPLHSSLFFLVGMGWFLVLNLLFPACIWFSKTLWI